MKMFWLGVLASLIAAEIFGWLGVFARVVLVRASKRLPESRRDVLLEDWLGNLDHLPGGLSKLMWAIPIALWGASGISAIEPTRQASKTEWWRPIIWLHDRVEPFRDALKLVLSISAAPASGLLLFYARKAAALDLQAGVAAHPSDPLMFAILTWYFRLSWFLLPLGVYVFATRQKSSISDKHLRSK